MTSSWRRLRKFFQIHSREISPLLSFVASGFLLPALLKSISYQVIFAPLAWSLPEAPECLNSLLGSAGGEGWLFSLVAAILFLLPTLMFSQPFLAGQLLLPALTPFPVATPTMHNWEFLCLQFADGEGFNYTSAGSSSLIYTLTACSLHLYFC